MTNKPLIIGVAGRARHGKDTIADYLCNRHDFIRLAFADPIVDGLMAMFNFPAEYRHTRKEEPLPGFTFSYRKAAQTLGTEWGRYELDQNIWIKCMEKRINEFADYNDRIVIPDVRFENEAAWIRQRGFLWHVYRPNIEDIDWHRSESGVQMEIGETKLINQELNQLHQGIEAHYQRTLCQIKAA